MKYLCPICNNYISENNDETKYIFCQNCNNKFILSHLLNFEEINKIENIKSNPPKNIKLKLCDKKYKISIYTHSFSFLTIFAIIFSWGTLFTFIALNGTIIFRKDFDFNNLFATSIWLLFLYSTIYLWYETIYSIFGKIELLYGERNYIFKGFGRIGLKKHIDWEKIIDFFVFTYYTDTEDGPFRSDYFLIRLDYKKQIKISLKYINQHKIDILILFIKLYRYNAIMKNKNYN